MADARVAKRLAAQQAVADEWGFTDPKIAALMLKRQERHRKLQRESEKRKQRQDPMKRLEALQHQRAHDGARPPIPQQQQQLLLPRKAVLPASQVLISRNAPPPQGAVGGGLQWLGPPEGEDPRQGGGPGGWSSANAAVGERAAGGGDAAAMEVGEELEVASVAASDHAGGLPPAPQPLRAFNSDAPNVKLLRSASRQRNGAAAAPLHVSNFGWMTPPASAGASGGTDVLPVGAAMRVARARQ